MRREASRPDGPPAWQRRVLLAVTAAVAVAVMVAAHEVMLPFVLATVIAYVLTPLVARVERRRVPRPVAVLLVYAVAVGAIGGFARVITPRIALELRALSAELPHLAEDARTRWIPFATERLKALGIAPETPPPTAEPTATSAFVARPQADGSIAIDVGSGVEVTETKHGFIVEPASTRKEPPPLDPNRILSDAVGKTFAYAQDNSIEIARALREVIVGASRVLFVFFITLMLAAYLILTREHVMAFFRSLVRPSARPGFDALLGRIDRGLSGVVRGQLVICGINGALSAVGFGLAGLKYWPVLALVAAIFSLIPVFGSIASAVPAVAVGLTQGLGTATFVLAWILGIHQLEANFLNPKIMGDSAKIHPVLVIFSLLVGEHFFQAIGALLAVPVMSMAQSVFLHLREATGRDEADVGP